MHESSLDADNKKGLVNITMELSERMWNKFKLYHSKMKLPNRNQGKQIVKYTLLVFLGIFLIHLFQNLYFLYFSMLHESDAHKRAVILDQFQMEDGQTKNHKIPRIVHQLWLGGKPMPPRMYESINSWKSQAPGIKYMLWNDTSVNQFLNKHYPWIVGLYNSYPYTINRCDMIRYVILFHYGGVYADLEFFCPKGIEAFYTLVGNAEVGIIPSNPFGFNCHFMIAGKRTNFMKYAVSNLFHFRRWYYTPYLNVMLNAGPLFLTSQYNQYPFKDQIRKVPDAFLYKHCNSKGGGNWNYWDTRLIWFVHRNRTAISNIFIIAFAFTISFIVFKCYAKYRRKRTLVMAH